MAPELIGLIGIIIIVVLIGLGIPIAISMISVSVAGIFYFRGFEATLELFGNNIYGTAANFTFAAIPLFLLMGYLAYNSGLAGKAFDAAGLWLSRAPGGLGMATSVASGMLGACMGSGAAATAAMTRIAVPEMIRQGYDKSLATGTVSAAATVAVLIPPSVIMVVYASFTEVSLGKMLLAGYIPGILSIVLYMVMIGIRVKLNPRLAPSISGEVITWKRRFISLKDAWGIALLIAILLGGLYSGFVTATETAAIGALAALIIWFLSKKFSWSVFRESSFETLRVGSMMFLLMIGAGALSVFLLFSGIPNMLTMLIINANLPATGVVIMALLLMFVLGAFIDGLSILLLTIPMLLPIFQELNVDLIWYGIIYIKMVEVAAITPPFGSSVYIVKGVLGDQVPLASIFRGIGWFVVIDILTIAILFAFPQITLWLPDAMRG